MNKNRVKRESCKKKYLVGKAIYYYEETPFCLISEAVVLNLGTMDVIYAF